MQKNIVKRTFDKATENPAFILSMGFLILISLGGLILSTSFVTQTGTRTGIIDSFFVAASASCVTGLSPVNTGHYWNTLGQVVIIILIQIGGLGIMTLASLIPLLLRKKIGIKSRQILKEQLNVESMAGMVKLFKYVLVFTLVAEGLGALLLSFRFVPSYGLGKGIWYSVFHSISAFCNAGFDILGDSIYPLRKDLLVNITIMALIVTGGLGFMVTSEIFYKRDIKKISTHSKLVLVINLALILVGAIGFFILESIQGGVLVGEGASGSITESFFQSISARTAGFYSVNLSNIKDSTSLLLMGLMFIGGSPGSTAGGIKTTTFGVLVLSTYSIIKKQREPVVFKKHISDESIKKALSIFMISFAIVLLVTFIITITDDFDLIDTLYETVSALATVGATRGITGELSNVAKILIGLCMYLGRIGPMTMAFAFGLEADEKLIRYPESFISLG
ncbi:TrkH family potassium uptake protein [uncultured Anaerococcus sp.]|uniref:TrkH family potassium uptake protein n=1 Tax=uncultured Anaerococcus sp. TaxID=293428 RepID=UPI00280B41A1|nr:TrkH family potassium uptake protein [uncultured Anaerococcus sp.]MDU5149615.1 TrkH family potassium uptake protein [Anaerococcus prevotii]